MATEPLSQLPVATSLTGSEIVPLVQSGVTKTIPASSIAGLVIPSQIVPLSTIAATFGGTQVYKFPAGLTLTGPLTGATTGAFSGAVNAVGLTSTAGVAVGGALTGATTGTFSGAVNSAGLTSTAGVAVGGALTGATTGAFSGAITGGSYSGGAISGTTGSFSGTVTAPTFSGNATSAGSAASVLGQVLGTFASMASSAAAGANVSILNWNATGGQGDVSIGTGYNPGTVMVSFWRSPAPPGTAYSNAASISSAGVLAAGSDVTLKSNIKTLHYGLDTINSLKPSFWTWNEHGNAGLGFIAQEMMEIIPEIVVDMADGLKGLEYTGVIPVLTKAVQELSTIIKEQNTRIDQLEGEIKMAVKLFNSMLKNK